MFNSRIVRVVLLIVSLFLLYISGVIARWHYGAMIVIRNESDQILRDVAVKVEMGGKRYSVGNLAPGKRSRVFAQLLAESHVNLEFRDMRNQPHVATVIGYVEAGEPYCARGDATILPSGEVESHDYTTLGACWRSWLDFFL